MEIKKIIKGIGSYRAVLKSDLGIFHIAELDECTSGYEAFLFFNRMKAESIEYRKEGEENWKTVYAVRDKELKICDESIFTELTVKDVKGGNSSEKAFKIYDIAGFSRTSIELKLK
jgi:hypothetical protein